MQLNAARAAVSTLAPRSGERVARAQRGPGEGQRLAVLLPLTRLAPPALATLSPLRGEGEDRAYRARDVSIGPKSALDNFDDALRGVNR